MTNSIKYRSKKLSFFHDDCFIMYFFGSLIIHSLFDTLANAGDTSIPHSGVFRRRKMKRPRLCPVHDPTWPILTSFIIWQRQILYLLMGWRKTRRSSWNPKIKACVLGQYTATKQHQARAKHAAGLIAAVVPVSFSGLVAPRCVSLLLGVSPMKSTHCSNE